MFKKISLEEIAILEEKIVKCYESKGITFDDNSLYKENSNEISIKAENNSYFHAFSLSNNKEIRVNFGGIYDINYINYSVFLLNHHMINHW